LTVAVTDPASVHPERSLTLDVRAEDLEMLLVDWLAELVHRFEVDQWLTASAEVAVGEDAAASICTPPCAVKPSTARATRSGVIKGVTYLRCRLPKRLADGPRRWCSISDLSGRAVRAPLVRGAPPHTPARSLAPARLGRRRV
jgi:SHS2 domain-containing protein